MKSTGTRRLASSFRKLARLFAVLFVLTNVLSSHADARVQFSMPCSMTAATVEAALGDQSKLPRDTVPGHVMTQCPCSVSVLPDTPEQPSQFHFEAVRFASHAVPAMESGALSPPARPPRT